VGYILGECKIWQVFVNTLFLFTKHFLSKERTCAKKEYNSFGKAFLRKKRFVLKENLLELIMRHCHNHTVNFKFHIQLIQRVKFDMEVGHFCV
jgi:hypothetical protein